MPELRRIVWLHSAVAVLALATLLTAYFWRDSRPPSWPFPQERPELVTKIKDIQDIEHLRKVSLLLVKGSNDLASDANNVVNSAIRLVFVLLGSIALLAVVSALWLAKQVRITQGRPVG